MNESRMKTKTTEGKKNQGPFHAIIRFLNILPNSQEMVASPILLQDMKNFMSHDRILLDRFARNKCRLERSYDLVKNELQTISNDLRNNFVNNVTQANGPKLTNHSRILRFRIENNISIV